MPPILYSIIGLSILILVHEFGHFLLARRIGVRIEKFSFGFGPPLFRFKNREGTQYLISAIPFGGYVELAGDDLKEIRGEKWEYLSRTIFERARIITAGPLLNYILAFFIFCFGFLVGCPYLSSKIGKVLEGFPAQEAGIKEDDKIVAIDGQKVETWGQITQIIHERIDEPVQLSLEREGEVFQLNIRPEGKELETISGRVKKVGLIGVEPKGEVIILKYGLLQSIEKGAQRVADLTILTFKVIGGLLTGGLSVKESLVSPAGIIYLSTKAAGLGLAHFLQVLGILSASLAIFNILPIPVLDGGHLLFLALEKLKGKGFSQKIQDRVTPAMLFLLLSLMVFLFYQDIVRFEFLDKALEWWQGKSPFRTVNNVSD